MIAEAREHLPAILSRRGIAAANGLAVLDSIRGIVQTVRAEEYASFETTAKSRLALRDLDDWPVLATALAFRCPIWTEDVDFFGTGVATWTTNRLELFFDAPSAEK
jgi:predicted nucleic acid-binding protein